ncbi:MAG: hypothetical protein ACD_79C00740G0002 [uncultured bacterium]|nr:MAG: hypothetical protein ACD_79C00740G0002 [uncultured bacterium]
MVSDVDFLSNRFSLNITNLFGNTLISPINDNINFFFNAIESISGSINLISIRSRGKFSRPFDKVAEIEANAQMKWQQEEKILVQKVDEANKNISELMKQEDNKNKKAIANAAILAEVQKFREEKKESQKKLREVRKNLRQEKESLGTQLFLFNTFLIPFMILCFGLYCLINPRKTKV